MYIILILKMKKKKEKRGVLLHTIYYTTLRVTVRIVSTIKK